MKPIKFLNLASAIAFITSIALGYIMVPSEKWTDDSMLAFSLLALGIYGIFTMPAKRKGNSDAVVFASIGPIFFMAVGFLVIASLAFYFSLEGKFTASRALVVADLGLLAVGYFITKSALAIVEGVSNRIDNSGFKSAALDLINDQRFSPLKARHPKLWVKMNEMIEYAPSDNGIATVSDFEILQILNELLRMQGADMRCEAKMEQVTFMLEKRNSELLGRRTGRR